MTYWTDRQRLPYYEHVRALLESLGPCESIVDVGCWDTPIATWGRFACRYAVDPCEVPRSPDVEHVRGRWPECADRVPRCEVVTCLQVLEHLVDPQPFCAALFAHATRAVILSVPWLWVAGVCVSHVQDPVDAAKLRSWTGRDPDQLTIVGEPARAVALYFCRSSQ